MVNSIIFIELAFIILLIWGCRLIIIENEKLENELRELEKSNKELLNVNFKLTKDVKK